ncbi:MAG TPA: S26 family signal peptidase [Thermoanaerobaculia bacterium]|nr:S26 family signal peptidase [Thermoanaerobaculia bacterium]
MAAALHDADVYRFALSRDNYGPRKLAAGQLFVLGDNRDQSSDSRYWGPIDRDAVKGRPVLLFMSNRGFWRP